jgi:Na+-translocating ferredoxin:NAD+ oxidoreductase RnfD subunit
MPLILAWIGMFAVQGVVRCLINDLPLTVGLVPLTGVSFLLFTFYMVTDPGATPSSSREQILFGAAIAVVYCLLILTHVEYGFFYSLFIVSFLRGFILRLKAMRVSPA